MKDPQISQIYIDFKHLQAERQARRIQLFNLCESVKSVDSHPFWVL